MTTKERLIQELTNSPEELVEELMDFLLFIRSRRWQMPKLQQKYSIASQRLSKNLFNPDRLQDVLVKEIDKIVRG